MKSTKYILFSLLAAAFLMGVTTNSVLAQSGEEEKWTICHHTESPTNPYVRIVVSDKSVGGHFDANGNPLHGGDLLLTGEQNCPGTPVVPEFGLLTGAFAALSSAGAFFFLKKRNS